MSNTSNICQITDYRMSLLPPSFTFNTLLECAAITSIFILSYYYGRGIVNIKYIHAILFSILLSYSAYKDIENITMSMSDIDSSWLHIDIVSVYFYFSYIAYDVYIYWMEKSSYTRLITSVSTIGMFYLYTSGTFRILIAVILFVANGHVYVIHHVLDYFHAAGNMGTLTYKRWIALTYIYGIIPIVLGVYVLTGYMISTHIQNSVLFSYLNITSGIFAMLVNLLYVIFEAYIAVSDYGYNRALMRVSGIEAV